MQKGSPNPTRKRNGAVSSTDLFVEIDTPWHTALYLQATGAVLPLHACRLAWGWRGVAN